MAGCYSVCYSDALQSVGCLANPLVRWVGLSGLEPLTSALSGQRSNRLSYRPGSDARLGANAQGYPMPAVPLKSLPRALSVLGEGDLQAAEDSCGEVVQE